MVGRIENKQIMFYYDGLNYFKVSVPLDFVEVSLSVQLMFFLISTIDFKSSNVYFFVSLCHIFVLRQNSKFSNSALFLVDLSKWNLCSTSKVLPSILDSKKARDCYKTGNFDLCVDCIHEDDTFIINT